MLIAVCYANINEDSAQKSRSTTNNPRPNPASNSARFLVDPQDFCTDPCKVAIRALSHLFVSYPANLPRRSGRLLPMEISILVVEKPRHFASHFGKHSYRRLLRRPGSAHPALERGRGAHHRINSDGQDLVTKLAQELGKLPNKIAIEGHTDSKPCSGSRHYSNWELSADRANSAQRLMQVNGIRADQVTAVRGFADQRLRKIDAPPDPLNRRFSLIVQYLLKPSGDDDAKPAAEGSSAAGPKPSDGPPPVPAPATSAPTPLPPHEK